MMFCGGGWFAGRYDVFCFFVLVLVLLVVIDLLLVFSVCVVVGLCSGFFVVALHG